MNGKILCIRGNHDRHLVEQEPDEMGPSDRAAYAQLRAAHLEWLRGLPPVSNLPADILLCHGTPKSDMT